MTLEPLQRLADTAALSTAIERKRMLVIVNPSASMMSGRLRGLVLAALAGRYDVAALDTRGPNHATDLARDAARDGFDVVVSFGGDGTVNEVANGLAGSRTPLTCLPGGATNALGKMLGIPGDVVDATQHLLHVADRWHPRRIDLGTANGRAFTYCSGLGLDASVVKRIDAQPRLKRHRLREYYFVYAAIETVLRHYVLHPPRMEVHVGGETVRGITTLVQNGDTFTYLDDKPLVIAEGATLDGGTLAGVVLRRARAYDVPPVAWRLLSKQRSVTTYSQVHGFKDIRDLRCVTADGRPIALHVDGDHIGDVTEAVFGIRPQALTVVA